MAISSFMIQQALRDLRVWRCTTGAGSPCLNYHRNYPTESNMAMEYPPFIDDVSISTSIDIWYDMIWYDIWIYMIYDLWFMIYDLCFMIYDTWYMKHDTWYWYCYGMVWYGMDVWMYGCMYIIVYIIILIGYFPASHVWANPRVSTCLFFDQSCLLHHDQGLLPLLTWA